MRASFGLLFWAMAAALASMAASPSLVMAGGALAGLLLKQADVVAPETALDVLAGVGYHVLWPAAAARAALLLPEAGGIAGMESMAAAAVGGMLLSMAAAYGAARVSLLATAATLDLPASLAKAMLLPMALGVGCAAVVPAAALGVAPEAAATAAQAVVAPLAFLAACVAGAGAAAATGSDARGVVTHDDGGRYAGDWADVADATDDGNDAVKEGYGVYVYPSGARFEGEWESGRKDGRGVYTFANGATVAATWRDGKRQGYGVRNGETLVAYRDDAKVKHSLAPREARRRARGVAQRAAAAAAAARAAAERAVARADAARHATGRRGIVRAALVPAAAFAVALALRLGSPPGSLHGVLPLLDVLADAHAPLCAFAAGVLLPCRGQPAAAAMRFAMRFAVARHVAPVAVALVLGALGVALATPATKGLAVALSWASAAALAFAAWPAALAPAILASRREPVAATAAAAAALCASCVSSAAIDLGSIVAKPDRSGRAQSAARVPPSAARRGGVEEERLRLGPGSEPSASDQQTRAKPAGAAPADSPVPVGAPAVAPGSVGASAGAHGPSHGTAPDRGLPPLARLATAFCARRAPMVRATLRVRAMRVHAL